jgi:hypothetical protein
LAGSASAPGFNQKDINLIIYSEAIPLSHASIAGVAPKRRDPQPVAVMPATMAGAYLCRRFYVHPEIADSVRFRSRVSELMAAGQVERTDDRTTNDGGRNVMLWRAAQ